MLVKQWFQVGGMTELCVRCSASDDMERLMIGKLKMRNGSQYTSKLEGMYVEFWTILYIVFIL